MIPIVKITKIHPSTLLFENPSFFLLIDVQPDKTVVVIGFYDDHYLKDFFVKSLKEKFLDKIGVFPVQYDDGVLTYFEGFLYGTSILKAYQEFLIEVEDQALLN